MCISPKYVWVERGGKWDQVQVACKHCWQCCKTRIDDFVGRCLAEAAYSKWVAFVTLTYRPSEERKVDLADKVIYPRHWQLAAKALRNSGHVIKYMVAGEYGDLLGRAHFHCVLFGKTPKPEWREYVNTDLDWWPHGFAQVQFTPLEKAMRYVAKYSMKSADKASWFMMSKYPPLGHQFFLDLAARHADLGVLPNRWAYVPPGCDPSRTYLMSGACRRDYLATLLERRGLSIEAAKQLGNDWVAKSVAKLDKWQRGKVETNEDDIAAFASDLLDRRLFDPKLELGTIVERMTDQRIIELGLEAQGKPPVELKDLTKLIEERVYGNVSTAAGSPRRKKG